jgi:hypothetical protein
MPVSTLAASAETAADIGLVRSFGSARHSPVIPSANSASNVSPPALSCAEITVSLWGTIA